MKSQVILEVNLQSNVHLGDEIVDVIRMSVSLVELLTQKVGSHVSSRKFSLYHGTEIGSVFTES